MTDDNDEKEDYIDYHDDVIDDGDRNNGDGFGSYFHCGSDNDASD